MNSFRLSRSCRVAAFGLVLFGLAAAPLAAATLTGFVRNEAGTGLANVDLDFIDQCSGDNIFLSGDKTAADGSYSVVVPAGTYDIHYTPPAGSPVAAGTAVASRPSPAPASASRRCTRVASSRAW